MRTAELSALYSSTPAARVRLEVLLVIIVVSWLTLNAHSRGFVDGAGGTGPENEKRALTSFSASEVASWGNSNRITAPKPAS